MWDFYSYLMAFLIRWYLLIRSKSQVPVYVSRSFLLFQVMVAAAEYAGKLSPQYVASLQGIIFAAHYCFGMLLHHSACLHEVTVIY